MSETTTPILSAIAADPNVNPAFAAALRRIGRPVRVDCICPPVPSRNYDFQATTTDYDEGDPIGCGATEAAALRDLAEQIDADEPDYGDETPIRDDRFADCAAADFEASRCGQ